MYLKGSKSIWVCAVAALAVCLSVGNAIADCEHVIWRLTIRGPCGEWTQILGNPLPVCPEAGLYSRHCPVTRLDLHRETCFRWEFSFEPLGSRQIPVSTRYWVTIFSTADETEFKWVGCAGERVLPPSSSVIYEKIFAPPVYRAIERGGRPDRLLEEQDTLLAKIGGVVQLGVPNLLAIAAHELEFNVSCPPPAYDMQCVSEQVGIGWLGVAEVFSNIAQRLQGEGLDEETLRSLNSAVERFAIASNQIGSELVEDHLSSTALLSAADAIDAMLEKLKVLMAADRLENVQGDLAALSDRLRRSAPSNGGWLVFDQTAGAEENDALAWLSEFGDAIGQIAVKLASDEE